MASGTIKARIAVGAGDPQDVTASEIRTLLNVEEGAQVNVGTDLSYTASSRLLSSSTGADVTLPLASPAEPGLLSAADQAKINAAVLLAQLRNSRKIYVSLEGNDSNNGTSEAEPLRTLRAASLAAQPGDVVFVAPGLYIEIILPIRWKHDVTVFGSGLRSTIVQPFPGQEFNDVFKVDSGFWCWGVSFAGHQADETRQAWAISFDELADNTGRGAIGLGAFILKSPYIQNCTSITAEDDAGLAGSQSTGNTGGGIRVDGSQCAINSPIRSMVVDSYTQVNLGGPGCLVLNDGYAQLVSFFGTFCTYHVRTETGGQVNLSGGGTTDFGIYGLMADGYSRSPMFTGGARVAAYGAVRLQKTVTIDVDTDLFGCTGHELSAGDQVVINATQGALPTGISANTVYFVIASGLTADAFKLSTAAGGSSLDMSGSASGTYEFVRQGVTQLDVVGFSANRLGRQIKYPSAGSLGSPGNPVQISARGGSTPGSTFTVTLGTSTIGHEYVGGGVVTVGGTDYPITSATYDGATGVTVLTATGYAPTIGASITLAGLSFICDSASRPNAGQIMFPQLVFPRNASTEAPEAKTFAYTRTGNFTLTYTEAASPAGPEHEYVSGGTVVIGGTDYGVANAIYNKTTGLVTLTTELQLPAGDGNVTVDGLRFICPTSGYVVTSSVPINASGVEVANTDPARAGYRVVFFSGTNGGLKDPISQGQVLDFRNRSQITAPGHTFEFVGSGTNYDALPQNGGIPVQANAIVETNNGKVYSSNTNEKGDFRVGDQFAVDGTTGSVTINSDQFNLSGLNFIGPFSRNGGISTVGEQLRELSNNTSLIASTGTPDGNTAPTQFAVKTYGDNKFLQDVTVTAGTPLILTDTSTQDGQGFWTRRRNLSISATPTFEGLTVTGTANLEHIHGNLAGEVYQHVRADGVSLAALVPYHVTGSQGDTDRVLVIAARGDTVAAMPASGILPAALSPNQDGHGAVAGVITGINTAGLTSGDPVYVGLTGGLTATRPTTGLVQVVAVVGRVHASTGSLAVAAGPALPPLAYTAAYADLSGLPTIPAPADAAPAALAATAAIGTSTDYAREDHAHQRDSDVIVIPVGDESTALTTGTAKISFRMPFAATLLAVRASVNTAPTGSTLIVDINEGGTSVLGTKLSIDATELTSTTAASAATITDSSLADDALITIDIDQIGSTIAGAGLKVSLFVRRS
jgi:hypothetical protein